MKSIWRATRSWTDPGPLRLRDEGQAARPGAGRTETRLGLAAGGQILGVDLKPITSKHPLCLGEGGCPAVAALVTGSFTSGPLQGVPCRGSTRAQAQGPTPPAPVGQALILPGPNRLCSLNSEGVAQLCAHPRPPSEPGLSLRPLKWVAQLCPLWLPRACGHPDPKVTATELPASSFSTPPLTAASRG